MRLTKLCLLVLLLASPGAQAVTIFYGTMSGANENPANASPASGTATVTIDGNSMTVDLVWSGLVGGAPTAGHIHCCIDPGTNVGVAVGFPGLPATASGTYLHVFNLLDSTIYTSGFLSGFGGGTAVGARDALIAGLTAGRAYSNLHNATFPGGEIRANLRQVPEPGTLGLAAVGLAALLLLRRRVAISQSMPRWVK